MRWIHGDPDSVPEPTPSWDIYTVDAFGLPHEKIAHVTDARTMDEALEMLVRQWPEAPCEFVHVMRSRSLPPWPDSDGD